MRLLDMRHEKGLEREARSESIATVVAGAAMPVSKATDGRVGTSSSATW